MLYWIPQFIMVFLLSLPVGANLSMWVDKKIKFIDVIVTISKYLTLLGLLEWGGFFR